MAIEREVKMAVDAAFELPALGGLVDHVQTKARPPKTLTGVYYDTADLRLARWGLSLRHRSGDGTGWTVKLPESHDGPALVRRELTFDGPPTAIPIGARALVTAYARSAVLKPVARMRTVRTAVDLLDAEGALVAEVVDDHVSILHGRRVASRFREVEVEVDDRAPAELLKTMVCSMRAAGAGKPDPTPKVVRALGPLALNPPEVTLGALGEKPTAGDVFVQALAGSVIRILRHDPGVRIGDDPEDVHQFRVGTRRLRSDLATFAPLVEEEWAAALRSELGWLAAALGAVRDADVLEARLRAQAATLPELDTPGLAPLFRHLITQRDAARVALSAAMTGNRYVALLDALVAAVEAPVWCTPSTRQARKVIPGLVTGRWGRLTRAVHALPADPSGEELHRIRILAKRARYAADAAVPLVGKRAARFATALANLQTVLGDHQDAVLAEVWLRSALGAVAPGATLAGGELIAIQWAAATASAKRWRRAWAKASDKKLREWL